MYVEFFGISRERTGVGEWELEADTLGEALDALSVRFPRLGEFIAAGTLHPSLAANLNCDTFVSDPLTRLTKTDRLLILSADAGG
jgi:molybdopterin converting factor small subunit